MATAKDEQSSARPSHEVSGRGYPGEWARRIELYLDKEPRRLVFFTGLFGGFVLCVVIALVIGVAMVDG